MKLFAPPERLFSSLAVLRRSGRVESVSWHIRFQVKATSTCQSALPESPKLYQSMELIMGVTTTTIAFILLPGTLLFGQARTITLDQSRQLALERNLDVVQAQNNVEAAQSGVLAAYGNYLPTLSASGTWSHTRNSAVFVGGEQITGGQTRVNDYYSTGLDLNYTIFNGFSREATMNRSTSFAVSSENIAARTRQSIAFQVEAGYLNVLRNEQLVRVSEENLKRDRRQMERITEANRVGSLSLADVYRQQSQVAQDELSLITAQNNYDKSRVDLVALIGLDVADEYSFVDPSLGTEISQGELEATTAQSKDFTASSQRALSLRPDYISASEQLDAAGSGVAIARAGYLPSVSAFAGYSLSDRKISNLSDNKNMNVGLSIRWNLFDGFQTNQSLQTALASERNAEITLVQAQRSINVEIKKALLDLEAARKQYEVSQKGLISATEDRKIAEERYNLGAGTLLDLLTANAGLVNAEANKINAVYNYITAKRNMEYALGERKL